MNLYDNIICPICGDLMEKYLFDYNTNNDEKINFSCPTCGHKLTKLLE
ncbi:hypothetical protein ACQPU1_03665 [Clostridium paraputrificum]